MAPQVKYGWESVNMQESQRRFMEGFITRGCETGRSTPAGWCAEKIKSFPDVIKEKEVMRFWEFTVPHEQLIDAREISTGLSRENPLIICKGKETVAMFHRSLVIKAEILGITFFQLIDETTLKGVHYSILDNKDKTAIKKTIAWAKKVKCAKWGSKKTLETVSIITPQI